MKIVSPLLKTISNQDLSSGVAYINQLLGAAHPEAGQTTEKGLKRLKMAEKK